MKKGILFLFLFIFFIRLSSAGLGISPSVAFFHFEPGKEIVITYHIYADEPDKKINISFDGDLKNFAKANKNLLIGPDSILVTLTLPNSLDPPGDHILSVVASEMSPDGKGGFFSTFITVIGDVKIRVPYHGEYVEATLAVPDANAGDDIPVTLHMINRGNKQAIAQGRVSIYTLGKQVGSISYPVALLEANDGEQSLTEILSTKDFTPGDYFAEATVSYGKSFTTNKTFRVGSLFVNVSNFTTVLEKNGIQKFYVDVESRWNKELTDVFADVNISGNRNESFRTPSVTLSPWEKTRLEGFLDTTNLEGNYDTHIVLNYAGAQTFAQGSLIVENKNKKLFIILGTSVIALVILIIAVFVYIKKRKKIKNENQRQ